MSDITAAGNPSPFAKVTSDYDHEAPKQDPVKQGGVNGCKCSGLKSPGGALTLKGGTGKVGGQDPPFHAFPNVL